MLFVLRKIIYTTEKNKSKVENWLDLLERVFYFFFIFFVDEEREETERLPDELLILELEEELREDDLNEEVRLREGDTDLEEKDLALEELLLGDTYERLVFER